MTILWRLVLVGALVAAPLSGLALAGDLNNPQHLNNSGQGKVSNVKAKQWLQQDGSKGGYEQLEGQSIVNVGSRRAGTCNLNVGASAPGQNQKEVVVTAKNIINVCK